MLVTLSIQLKKHYLLLYPFRKAYNKRIKSDVTHCPIFCLKENDAKKRPICSAAYAGVICHGEIAIFDISIILFPTTILVFVYLFWKRVKESPELFWGVWFSSLVVLFIFGTLIWDPKYEISQFGNGLIVSSSIWLNGIVGALTVKSSKLRFWFIPISALLALLSVLLCFIILTLSGQIWGF